MDKKMELIEYPVELNFCYDLKIENEIKKSIGIFEKFVSPLIYSFHNWDFLVHGSYTRKCRLYH